MVSVNIVLRLQKDLAERLRRQRGLPKGYHAYVGESKIFTSYVDPNWNETIDVSVEPVKTITNEWDSGRLFTVNLRFECQKCKQVSIQYSATFRGYHPLGQSHKDTYSRIVLGYECAECWSLSPFTVSSDEENLFEEDSEEEIVYQGKGTGASTSTGSS